MTPASGKASVNFQGRFFFLEAAEQHWPQLLTTLPWREWPRMQAGDRRPESFQEVEDNPLYGNWCVALLKWAEMHQMKATWIFDAVVETLTTAPVGSPPPRWWYTPDELPVPTFSLEFKAVWIPGWSPWPEFKAELQRTLVRRLEEYRKQVNETWGSGRHKLALHAVWTVLWQRGKSPEWIQKWNRTANSKSVSMANIQKSVHEFASSMDLALRQSRGGPRPRI
jgi:hypothetical protein